MSINVHQLRDVPACGKNLASEDAERLRQTRVALPGLGGVGGAHLEALARLGIGAFHLADPDTFEVVNFNRQSGATMNSLGRRKVDVTAELALAINPKVEVSLFPEGISKENIDSFLCGVDVVVDGIEYFAIETRRMLYAACHTRQIPVVHAGPIGYGASIMVFMPGGMSFDEYFRIDDSMTRAEMLLAHALGQRGLKGDIDPSRIDFSKRTGPALGSTCMLCASVAATEVLKLILKHGKPAVAPQGLYFDLYRGRTRRLRPAPALSKSWRGRILRWLAFRSVPGLRAMHDEEMTCRNPKGNHPGKAVLLNP